MLPLTFTLDSESNQEPGGLLSKRALPLEGYSVAVRVPALEGSTDQLVGNDFLYF